MEAQTGIVVFGDVVASRRDPAGSTAWLRALVAELDAAYAGARLAPFDFTQGDELQGLLRPAADPLLAVLRAALHPQARPMRWAVVIGVVEGGSGPATQRAGPAFLAARQALGRARLQRVGFVAETGEPRADRLLADLAPLLAEHLDGLTVRQREVARLALLDGLRQAEIADRLGIARATVTVIAARARLRSLGRLTTALRTLLAEGAAAG